MSASPTTFTTRPNVDAEPSASYPRPPERRALLVPPTSRDAAAIRTVLEESSIECVVFGSLPELCHALHDGAAVVIVSEEVLTADQECLLKTLASQPVWADLPVIVLSRPGSESPRLTTLLEQSGNVFVVERPVRVSTFLSLVRVAIRGRLRQYQVREHLQQIQAAQAERTSLWESERTARAEAERAGRMKDEFLATLSHEIRTPLNAILGWTHILGKRARQDDELEKGLAVIERNAKAQSRIVADLLDMNRIVNGKLRLDMRSISIAPLVQSAVDTVLPSAAAKGLHLHADLDAACAPVRGDSERLQQVFLNLLSNAIKFTPTGGRVGVLLKPISAHVQISVADTGEGIDPAFLPHVFDRFRQADGSTTRRHGGLGLGLAIVKQLVELHGGSVGATSVGPGMGSTFVVMLPLAADQPQEPPAPDLPAPATPTHDSSPTDTIRGLKILCVDDEPDSRELIQRLLEVAGARVIAASSVAEALALIPRHRPDLIISDIGMPGEDGYSLLRHVRALPKDQGGQTVAVALTAYARAEDRQNAISAGFQYHLSKPVDSAELLAVLSHAVQQSPPR